MIANPEMVATVGATPSPVARMMPTRVRATAMTYWPTSIARTVLRDAGDLLDCLRGVLTRLMGSFDSGGCD